MHNFECHKSPEWEKVEYVDMNEDQRITPECKHIKWPDINNYTLSYIYHSITHIDSINPFHVPPATAPYYFTLSNAR